MSSRATVSPRAMVAADSPGTCSESVPPSGASVISICEKPSRSTSLKRKKEWLKPVTSGSCWTCQRQSLAVGASFRPVTVITETTGQLVVLQRESEGADGNLPEIILEVHGLRGGAASHGGE